AASASTSPPAGGSAAVAVPASYTVQAGDTLMGIALKAGVPGDLRSSWVTALLKLNALSDPNNISVNQELKLPAAAAPSGAVAATTNAEAPTPAPQIPQAPQAIA